MSATTMDEDEELYEDDFEVEDSSAAQSTSKKSALDVLPQLVTRPLQQQQQQLAAKHNSFSSYDASNSSSRHHGKDQYDEIDEDEELDDAEQDSLHASSHHHYHHHQTPTRTSPSVLHTAQPAANKEPSKPRSVEQSPSVISSHLLSHAESNESNGMLHRSNITSVELIRETSESLVRGSHTSPMPPSQPKEGQEEERLGRQGNKNAAPSSVVRSAVTTSSARSSSSSSTSSSSSSSHKSNSDSSSDDDPAPPLALQTQQRRPSEMQPPVPATKGNEQSSITTFYKPPAQGVQKKESKPVNYNHHDDDDDRRAGKNNEDDETSDAMMDESEIEEEREMSIPSPDNTRAGRAMSQDHTHYNNNSGSSSEEDEEGRDGSAHNKPQQQRSPSPPVGGPHVVSAAATPQPDGHRTTPPPASADDEEETLSRSELEERIAQLKRAIIEWNKRIEAKEAELETRQRRRSRRANEETTATNNTMSNNNNDGRGARRTTASSLTATPNKASNTTLYPTSWSRQGMQADAERCQQELARLRAENATLEQLWSTYEGKVVNVMFLLARAAEQLTAMQEKLRTLKRTKLMLEQRDRRAAHVIEETSRRLPAREEREWHQVNDNFYSQAQLQRRVRETQQAIEASRRTCAMMEEKCAELESTVQGRHLSRMGPKEYRALRQMHAEQQRTIKRLRNAIAVYSGQSHATISVPASRPSSGLNDGVHESDPVGLVNTPVRGRGEGHKEPPTNASARRRSVSSLHSSRLGSSSGGGAHGGASSTAGESLLSQYESVVERRKNMQRELDALARKVELCSAHSRNGTEGKAGGARSPTTTTPSREGAANKNGSKGESEALLPSRAPRGAVRSSPAKPPSARHAAPHAGLHGEPSAGRTERIATLPPLPQDTRVTQSAGQAQASSRAPGAEAVPMVLPDIHRSAAAKSPPVAALLPAVANKASSSANRGEEQPPQQQHGKTHDRLVVMCEGSEAGGDGAAKAKAVSSPPMSQVKPQQHTPVVADDGLASKAPEDKTRTPASRGLASSPEEDVVEAIEAGESGRSTPLWLR